MKKNNKILLKFGYGTCPLGGVTLLGKKNIGMGEQSIEVSKKCLLHAYNKGIKFFETADIYGNGKVEKIIGLTLNDKKDIKICTKFGNRFIKNKIVFDTSIEYFDYSLNSSLERLKRNYVDIYLIHSPSKYYVINSSLQKKIFKCLKIGKILNFGISCRTVEDSINFINRYDFIKYIEVNYNILDRRVEDKLFDIAKKKNIAIIARAPFANGMIFKSNLVKKFKKNDFRSNVDIQTKRWIAEQIAKMDYKTYNFNIASLAFRYCLSNDNIKYVIPGMRSVKQINNNIKSYKLGKLKKKEKELIKKNIPITYEKWL